MTMLLGNQTLTSNSCVKANSLNIQSECTENGYSNWNGYRWYSDGVNCWCEEKENVSNPCTDDDPGEN